MHSPLEQRRDEEDRRQFRQLGWLDAEKPETEPAAGVVDGRTEQHQHQRHPDDAEARPDEDRLTVGPVVDSHYDRENRQPEHGPQALLDQEGRALPYLSSASGAEALYTMTTLTATSRIVVRNNVCRI